MHFCEFFSNFTLFLSIFYSVDFEVFHFSHFLFINDDHWQICGYVAHFDQRFTGLFRPAGFIVDKNWQFYFGIFPFVLWMDSLCDRHICQSNDPNTDTVDKRTDLDIDPYTLYRDECDNTLMYHIRSCNFYGWIDHSILDQHHYHAPLEMKRFSILNIFEIFATENVKKENVCGG